MLQEINFLDRVPAAEEHAYPQESTSYCIHGQHIREAATYPQPECLPRSSAFGRLQHALEKLLLVCISLEIARHPIGVV